MKNIDNKNEEKFKCVCSSKNIFPENNKYIHSSKFISNNSFIIFNDKNVIKYNYDYDYDLSSDFFKLNLNHSQKEFIENNYIYDYDLISDNYGINSNICLCSKDNPIRILDNDLSLVKSFSLENKEKDAFLSSTFIKYEQFGLNIYTGKNFLCKLDLVKQKEMLINYNKNYNNLSCFDFNIKYSCYFLGSYSKNLLMCDYRTDKIIEEFKQNKSINQIKLLDNKNYNIIVGFRNSDYICIFDIRKMNNYLYKLERDALTTQKINFVLDNKDSILYTGTVNGKLIKYNFSDEFFQKENNNNIDYPEKFNKEEYDIGISDCISSIDLNNDLNLILVTNGKRNDNNNETNYYFRNNKDSEDDFEIQKQSQNYFHIYKFYLNR